MTGETGLQFYAAVSLAVTHFSWPHLPMQGSTITPTSWLSVSSKSGNVPTAMPRTLWEFDKCHSSSLTTHQVYSFLGYHSCQTPVHLPRLPLSGQAQCPFPDRSTSYPRGSSKGQVTEAWVGLRTHRTWPLGAIRSKATAFLRAE